MKRLICVLSALAMAAAFSGCGAKECVLEDPSSCDEGLVCEVVQGRDKPLCAAPVELHGRVFDLETGAAIAGARVAAVDENRAPVGAVVTTDADGNYVLPVPSTRTDEQGTFVPRDVTLSASASDYERFPSGIRTAIPVDTAGATREGDHAPFILEGTPVEIGLQPLPEDQRGLPTISGVVEFGAETHSALVVAESTSSSGIARSAQADASGAYTIFNVPAGSYRVRAYSRGANFDPVDATVAAEDLTDVNLAPNAVAAATVTGSIQIVATTGQTSVILAVASTFDPESARGEAPAGLRAPDPGTAPNLTGGEFSITGVPDGRYVVLAAFENDGLVRDPDTSLGGTDLAYITVENGVADASPAFKVTSAITMVGPGAENLEVVPSAPTFSWVKYPSTDQYELLVVDSLGNPVWSTTAPGTGGGNASVAYAGPELAPGGVYQWRAYAKDTGGTRISATEDLRGVFQLARPE